MAHARASAIRYLMAIPVWRANLQPASYKGVPFHVKVDSRRSGRRIVPHEFPKRDKPYSEDMGRKIRRFLVEAYIVSGPNEPDYQARRDDLIVCLKTEGAGWLIHPTLGDDFVVVGDYDLVETAEE